MTEELDNKLCDKYPKIFRDRHASMTITAMCWGFECDDGWFKIIDNLCNKLQTYTDKDPEKRPQIVTTQVKEKFGGLRFYVNGADNTQWKMIEEAEHLSYNTCEKCGSAEHVGQTSGWIKTLCKECAEGNEHWEEYKE